MPTCRVLGCYGRNGQIYNGEKTRLFTFPQQNRSLALRWLELCRFLPKHCNINDYIFSVGHDRICSRHFAPDAYITGFDFENNPRKSGLKRDALPTLHMPSKASISATEISSHTLHKLASAKPKHAKPKYKFRAKGSSSSRPIAQLQPSTSTSDVLAFLQARKERKRVGEILERRKKGGRLEYKVRWKNSSSESDTWEPAENLRDAVGMIDIFNEKMLRKQGLIKPIKIKIKSSNDRMLSGTLLRLKNPRPVTPKLLQSPKHIMENKSKSEKGTAPTGIHRLNIAEQNDKLVKLSRQLSYDDYMIKYEYKKAKRAQMSPTSKSRPSSSISPQNKSPNLSDNKSKGTLLFPLTSKLLKSPKQLLKSHLTDEGMAGPTGVVHRLSADKQQQKLTKLAQQLSYDDYMNKFKKAKKQQKQHNKISQMSPTSRNRSQASPSSSSSGDNTTKSKLQHRSANFDSGKLLDSPNTSNNKSEETVLHPPTSELLKSPKQMFRSLSNDEDMAGPSLVHTICSSEQKERLAKLAKQLSYDDYMEKYKKSKNQEKHHSKMGQCSKMSPSESRRTTLVNNCEIATPAEKMRSSHCVAGVETDIVYAADDDGVVSFPKLRNTTFNGKGRGELSLTTPQITPQSTPPSTPNGSQAHQERSVHKTPSIMTPMARHKSSCSGSKEMISPTGSIKSKVIYPTKILPERLAGSVAKRRLSQLSMSSDDEDDNDRRFSTRVTENIFKYKEVVVKKSPGYTQVWLFTNSPSRNAVGVQALQELTSVLENAAKDETKVVVLCGSGSMFCSGLDLRLLATQSRDERKKTAKDLSDAVRTFVDTVINFPKLLVAAVNGPAIGFGAAILPLCDIVYASDKAYFHLPYNSIGMTPEGCSSFTYPHYLGLPLASDMLYCGRKLTALEAYTGGLVSQVLWPTTFMQEVIPRVQCMVSGSIKGLMLTKSLVRSHLRAKLEYTNESECAALKERWKSSECYKLVKNYVEKGYDLGC